MIELATIPKATKSAQIRNYVASNPKAKSADVAKAIGVTPAYVSTVLWNAKKKAKVAKKAKKATLTLPKPKWEQLGLFSSDKSLGQLAYEAGVGMAKLRMEGDRGGQIEMFEPKADPVNNPAHYTVGGIETIDFIEAKKLGYNLGNVIKYLTRADHKGNKMEDLRKAQWYLTREINSLK
jgi:hypothetical protein